MNKRKRIQEAVINLQREINNLQSELFALYRQRINGLTLADLNSIRDIANNLTDLSKDIENINKIDESPKKKKKHFKLDSQTAYSVIMTIGIFAFCFIVLGLCFAGVILYKSGLS